MTSSSLLISGFEMSSSCDCERKAGVSVQHNRCDLVTAVTAATGRLVENTLGRCDVSGGGDAEADGDGDGDGDGDTVEQREVVVVFFGRLSFADDADSLVCCSRGGRYSRHRLLPVMSPLRR